MNKDSLVVGSSVEALLHSYAKKVHIILSSFSPPTKDLYYENPLLYDGLVFLEQRDLWGYLKFLCAMEGLVINEKEPSSVRVTADEARIVDTHSATQIGFERCFLYQDNKIGCDLEIDSVVDQDTYKVLDFMKVRVGSYDGFKHLECKEFFVDNVIVDGPDVISVSYLNSEQLKDFEYSDTMSRFVVEKKLRERDLFELPHVDKEKRFKRSLKVEVVERVVIPMEIVYYKDTEKVKNCGREEERGAQ